MIHAHERSETGKDKRVALVVEYDPLVRKSLSFFLEQKGFIVFNTGNVEKAIDLVTQEYPHLILLDAGLPGNENCRFSLVLKKCDNNPVVIVVGEEGESTIEEAFRAGADDFICKPVHFSLIGFRINHLLEKRQAAIELGEFVGRLERRNRDLQDFTHVVSHDLQEPLHLILAFAQRIRTKTGIELNERARLYLERIESSAGRMQELIDGLLLYSRVTTRTQEFERVDLDAVVHDVLADLEVKIEQLGAEIKFQQLGSIEADSLQMRQLFQNLIGNALKYANHNRIPEVSIYALPRKSESGSGPMFEIVIEDNGIGFNENFSEQIFGIFQRLHGRSQYQGTGIGLALCKKIVERHHGSIYAASEVGVGSRFTVVLPAEQKKAVD